MAKCQIKFEVLHIKISSFFALEPRRRQLFSDLYNSAFLREIIALSGIPFFEFIQSDFNAISYIAVHSGNCHTIIREKMLSIDVLLRLPAATIEMVSSHYVDIFRLRKYISLSELLDLPFANCTMILENQETVSNLLKKDKFSKESLRAFSFEQLSSVLTNPASAEAEAILSSYQQFSPRASTHRYAGEFFSPCNFSPVPRGIGVVMVESDNLWGFNCTSI